MFSTILFLPAYFSISFPIVVFFVASWRTLVWISYECGLLWWGGSKGKVNQLHRFVRNGIEQWNESGFMIKVHIILIVINVFPPWNPLWYPIENTSKYNINIMYLFRWDRKELRIMYSGKFVCDTLAAITALKGGLRLMTRRANWKRVSEQRYIGTK